MHQPVQYSRSESGFTLIELMVALLIMMIGLLALLQSVNIAIANNASNKKRADAIRLADQAMGQERIRPFANLSAAPLSATKQAYAGLGFVNYSIVEKVRSLASNTKNVSITVSWREKGVRKEHTLTTVIATPPT